MPREQDLCAVCIADAVNDPSRVTYYDARDGRPLNSIGIDGRIAEIHELTESDKPWRKKLADYPSGRLLPFFAVTTVQGTRLCALHAAERPEYRVR